MKTWGRLLFVSVILSFLFQGNAHGFASCAGCFKSGMNTQCASCTGAMNSAVKIIEQGIYSSERIIHYSTGMPPEVRATGMVGFPMLATVVEASSAKATQDRLDAIDAVRDTLADEIRQIPFVHSEIESRWLAGPGHPDYGEDVAQSVSRSNAYRQEGAEALTQVMSFRVGNAPLKPLSEVRDEERGSRIRSNVNDPSLQNVSQITSLMNRVRNGTNDTTSRLNASLLVGDRHRVLGNTPRSGEEFSSEDLADYYLQLSLSADPSRAEDESLISSGSPALMLQASLDSSFSDMRLSLAASVQDRYLQMRRPHNRMSGTAEYLRRAIPGEISANVQRDSFDLNSTDNSLINDVASDEEMMYLMATHRARSPEWQSQIAVHEEYAARQNAMMAAERLGMAFERYQTRRDINIMLSQILAGNIRQETGAN